MVATRTFDVVQNGIGALITAMDESSRQKDRPAGTEQNASRGTGSMAGQHRQVGHLSAKGSRLGLLLTLLAISGCQWCPNQADTSASRRAGTDVEQGQQTGTRSHNPPGPATPANQQALVDAERGQRAMLRCLQSERALTDGNELRCEDWNVIRDEFLKP
jgi:hypothetical protein